MVSSSPHKLGDAEQSVQEQVEDKLTTPPPEHKTNSRGLVLVPQPSDHPRDPLNWPTWKKCLTLAVVSLISFAGAVQALANSAGYAAQAENYNKTPTDITYSVSAAIAGLAVGPFVWTPLAARFGKCGVLFWSLILMLVINIWSALMTNENDYVAFVVSRLFAGLAGSASAVVGAKIVTDVFFLHDRGKCLGIYSCWFLLGTISCSTFSGFIVENNPWPVQFWYNVAIEGFLAIILFLFVDETSWTRADGPVYPVLPEGFMARKMAIYFATRRITPTQTRSEAVQTATRPLIFLVSPVIVVVGMAQLVLFAWTVAVQTFQAIFLQNPIEAGGYAFSPTANAVFTFSSWIALFIAQAYIILVNDRLPLWICARFYGGRWSPELRLHSLWLPVLLIYPLGCGIFGACLKYHWHYMGLAVSGAMIGFSSITTVPALINYSIEALTPVYANEVACVMNFYRVVLGLTVNFYLEEWEAAVGIEWVFGTMAFLNILAFGVLVLVMWKGPRLRRISESFVKARNEEGVQVVS